MSAEVSVNILDNITNYFHFSNIIKKKAIYTILVKFKNNFLESKNLQTSIHEKRKHLLYSSTHISKCYVNMIY